MSPAPGIISVTDPISPALGRVKEVLFRPFDLGKWFAIGFGAWLSALGEGGFHGNFNLPSRSVGGSARREWERMKDFVMDNLSWLIPLAAFVLIAVIALWIVCLWLSSRGKFMFLHCVAVNRGEVKSPWHQFAREGNSLFLFRLVLWLMAGLASVACLLPITAGAIAITKATQVPAGAIWMIAIPALTFVAIIIVWALISKLTDDFVVPLMSLRRNTCLESWNEFLGLLLAHFWRFVLYLLFQVVIAIAIAILILALVLVTCCIAGCLLALPYLGTVLMLPLLVFLRSYSLLYFAQYGRQYSVIQLPPP